MPDFMIAYCGPAALPDDLWTRWNMDPLLISMLFAIAVAIGSGRSSNARAGWGAIALMFVIFVSPLCAMSSCFLSVYFTMSC
jgi:putative membrane protein